MTLRRVVVETTGDNWGMGAPQRREITAFSPEAIGAAAEVLHRMHCIGECARGVNESWRSNAEAILNAAAAIDFGWETNA